MDLALDIGNSAAKGALFEGRALRRVFRLGLAPATATPGDWRRALRGALEGATPDRAGVASVVPSASGHVRALLEAQALPSLFVRADEGLALPFALAYRTPATLGADRLAAAVGAWRRYGAGAGRSVVALDAGTALTYEVVRAGTAGASASYQGGAIAPGPALLRRALAGGTAQLPDVPLGEVPPSPVGASTKEALQSGLLYGLLDSADGMLRRLTETLDGSKNGGGSENDHASGSNAPPSRAPVVVSTGGWGALLHARLPRVTRYDPHLVLRGVHALMQLNPAGGTDRRGAQTKN